MSIEEVNKVLQVFVNAITLAQQRGAYSLEEAANIFAAIQSINNANSAVDAAATEQETPEQEQEESRQ